MLTFTTNKPEKPTAKKPDAIASPHILDQRTDPATCLKLNDTAAFITRFIVVGGGHLTYPPNPPVRIPGSRGNCQQ